MNPPPVFYKKDGGRIFGFCAGLKDGNIQKLPKWVYRVYLDVYLAGAGIDSGGGGVKGEGFFYWGEMSTRAGKVDFLKTRKGAWGLGFGGFLLKK